MFKQSRFLFSAAMIAILLFSALVLSKNISAKSRKCPVELPRTILTLYLQSDLVFIADIKNEKLTNIDNETEDSFYADVERNLVITKAFKGQKLPEFSFTKSEYREKANVVKTPENDENVVYVNHGSYGESELTVGKRYLLFFSKNDETGEYFPTDYRTSGREINQGNAGIYEKSLNELGKIVAGKKNQLPKLADWLVRLTEDETTRWDGATSLSRSFSTLAYAEENTESEEEPVTFDKDFNEYSAAIARQITDAQKERLSAVFLLSLNQTLLNGASDVDYDYSLAELVTKWDKSRFAMYGFGILQSVDKSDVERTKKIMNFVADMVDDEQLSTISYEFRELNIESENIVSEKVVEETSHPVVTVEKTEGEPQLEKIEQNTENINKTNEILQPENAEPEIEKPTQAQLLEQSFQKFVNRYQELLVRNFAPEPENDTAEIID